MINQNDDQKIINDSSVELFSCGEYDYSRNADITLFNYSENFIIEKNLKIWKIALNIKLKKVLSGLILIIFMIKR